MVNITVWSKNSINIENKNYGIDTMENTVNFLIALIDKIKFSGETICLQTARIDESKGEALFKTVTRWVRT